MSSEGETNQAHAAGGSGGSGPTRRLTRRESEILGLLAEGMSGAQIAEQLVLSPETVRTHVRNAMSKLGASTRSQAVAMILRQDAREDDEQTPRSAGGARAELSPVTASRALAGLLKRLMALHDIDRAVAYVAEDDGLSMRRAGVTGDTGLPNGMPDSFTLGEGTLGKVALERRVHLTSSPAGQGGMVAAPIVGKGRLFGVLALEARLSRPMGRSELLLLRAFTDRIGDVLAEGIDIERRLERTADRFQTSWAAAVRGT